MTRPPVDIGSIDHFSIPCKDPELSANFYCTLLGAHVYEDHNGPYKFGMAPEDMALKRSIHIFLEMECGQRIELLGEDPGGKAPLGTHHAFKIPPTDLDKMRGWLTELGIPYWGPATHRGTDAVSIYINDLDGNIIEFTVFKDYPELSKVPLSQHMERGSLKFDWNPDTRRGTPAEPRA